MNFHLVLTGTALRILLWEELPEWGHWFNILLARLPTSLRTLYAQWKCSWCSGFWIALALHAITGQWLIPDLANLNIQHGLVASIIGWFLDAIASATLINMLHLTIKAIGLPAMKAEFMKSIGLAPNEIVKDPKGSK